jgi:hypothetical protein
MKYKFLLPVFAAMLLVFACAKSDTGSTTGQTQNALKATATMVIGDVAVLRSGDAVRHAVKTGDELKPEDVIITGDTGRVNVVIAESGILQIAPRSQIVLSTLLLRPDGSAEQKLAVRTGRVVLGLKKLQRQSSFNVETPTAVAGVRGTSFVVDVQPVSDNAFPYFVKVGQGQVKTRVAVLSGAVEMSAPSSERTVMVEPMKMAVLDGADFQNIKVVPIERLYLSDLQEIRNMSELRSVDMADIAAEVGSIDPSVSGTVRKSLTVKSEVKRAGQESDVQVQDNVETTGKVEKVKTGQTREGKYIDPGSGW